jgi:hypothetical protein
MKPPQPDDTLRPAADLLRTRRAPFYSQIQTSRDRVRRKPPENNIAAFLSTHAAWLNWIYHYLKSRFGPRYAPRAYPYRGNTGIYRLAPGSLRIGIAADWGSYSDEADRVMQQLAATDPHYTLHLGDIYYTGTPEEVRASFTPPDPCWHYGSLGTYVLPGNHEMYCNGKGFFVTLLHLLRDTAARLHYAPGTVQASSYWCLDSDHWRIIGLDTGQHSVSIPGIEAIWPPPTYIDEQAVRWLREMVLTDPDDPRGLIIMSHHQIMSAFDDAYPRPMQQLDDILYGDRPGVRKRDLIWLWGHEHRMAVYERRALTPGGIAVWGRCIGHGGMPVELATPDPRRAADTGLLYHDDRLYTTVEGTRIGYCGYLHMEMDGPMLHLSYVDLCGTVIMQEQFAVDGSGGITHTILSDEKSN